MAVTLKQRPIISAGDVDLVSIDGQEYLDTGELFTGAPTVAEVTTTDLTLSNKVYNTAAITVLNRSVAIGKAVQFKVTGQLAGRRYRVRVTTTTDATPARTAVRDVIITCST